MSRLYSDFFGPNVTLGAGLNANTGDTTVSLSSVPTAFINDVSGQISASRPVPIRVGADVTSMEIMLLTSYDSVNDLWTVERAVDGTPVKSHASSDPVAHIGGQRNQGPPRKFAQSARPGMPASRWLAYDDFDRGSLGSMPTGQAWTIDTGSPVLSDEGQLVASTSNPYRVLASINLGLNRWHIEVSFYYGPYSNREFYIYTHFQDSNNWIRLQYRNGALRVQTKVSGTVSDRSLVSTSNNQGLFTAGAVADANGDALSLYLHPMSVDNSYSFTSGESSVATNSTQIGLGKNDFNDAKSNYFESLRLLKPAADPLA